MNNHRFGEKGEIKKNNPKIPKILKLKRQGDC
jgi:hypothetical protein